jgi:hypothetical protein
MSTRISLAVPSSVGVAAGLLASGREEIRVKGFSRASTSRAQAPTRTSGVWVVVRAGFFTDRSILTGTPR